MSLNNNFIAAMTDKTHRPNVVVVFSPKDTFYSTAQVQTPAGNSRFDGSKSYIFWKHEPDEIVHPTGEPLSITTQFSAFINNRLTKNDIPFNCIDSVSIAGGEIDIQDAAVQDDGVSINIVLDEVQHKQVFQELIGYNVEVYFGFSGQQFNFFDYERFYVGKLNGLSSPSPLTLQLKIGTLVDYWNKTWVHSQRIQNTKTAYEYPLDVDFKKRSRWTDLLFLNRDPSGYATTENPTGVFFRFEADLHRAINNVTDYSFDYDYQFLRLKRTTIFDSELGDHYQGFEFPPGSITEERILKPTTAIFFSPSGNIDNIKTTDPKYDHPLINYPEPDQGFLNARRSPTQHNRIRFKIRDTVFESNYIDEYIFWPLVFSLNTSTNNSIRGTRSYIFEVERLPNNIEAAQSIDVSTLNSLAPVAGSQYEFTLDAVEFQGHPIENTLERYTSIYDDSFHFRNMNRLKFATKLKVFLSPEEAKEHFAQIDAGSDVSFYDTKTGIGDLRQVLIDTLNLNLGINLSLIDANSFRLAKENFERLMKIPDSSRQTLRGDNEKVNSDYSFDGLSDAKEHIETTILKSNNLRMYTERGILKCLFLQSRDKLVLQEEVNGEFVPFLLSEDDLLESTTYETRPDEQIKRIKVTTSFSRPGDDEGDFTFYCVDDRNQDRTSGSIVVARQPGVGYTEDDFEEIEVRQNFTNSTRTHDAIGQQLGPVSTPYQLYSEIINTYLITYFATYYFNAANPFIKMTLVTGARGLLVSVGDVIVLRDHQAFNLFGSQFIKVMVVNKSVSDWGTSNLQVTLDVFFVGKSSDFLEAQRPTRPNKLRLISRSKSTRVSNKTRVVITFDEPDDWGHDVDNDLLNYRLYETTPGGDRLLQELGYSSNIATDVLSWNASTRTISMLLNNDSTYHLFVRADNGVFEGPSSNVLVINTFEGVTLPSPPRNLRITNTGAQSLDLAWDASADLGGSTNVEYIEYVNGVKTSNVGRFLSTGYFFADDTPGDVVEFYITAQNEIGESAPSNVVRFTVPPRLPVPEGFIRLNGWALGTSQINLTWSANITRGDVDVQYALYRSTRAGEDGRVVQNFLFTSPFVDTDLMPDTSYFYKIVARNVTGDGVESSQIEVKTLARIVRTAPNPPSGFRAGEAATQNSIQVEWDAYSPDDTGNSPITGFKICSSTDNSSFDCTDLGADVREHSFTSLSPNTLYYLTLRGVNAIGESEPVKLTIRTLDTVTEVPDAPVVSLYQSDETEVEVSVRVDDFDDKEVSSVEVQKSTDNSTFSSLANITSVTDNVVRTTDTGLTDNTTYYYRARAVNRVGNSAWSQVQSILVDDCSDRCTVIEDTDVRWENATAEQKRTNSFILKPSDADHCGPYKICDPEPVGRPRSLVVSDITHNSARVTWQEPLRTGNFSIVKYLVGFDGGIYETISTNINIAELDPETSYTLTVRAVNSLGTIGLEAITNFTTTATPPPPPKPKPNAPNVDQVTLTDNDMGIIRFDQSEDRQNKPVEEYRIYERTTSQDVLLRTIPASELQGEYNISTSVSLTKTYTTAGTYRFFMRAANSDATSEDSNVVHFVVDEPEPQVPDAPVFERVIINNTSFDTDYFQLFFTYINPTLPSAKPITGARIYLDGPTPVLLSFSTLQLGYATRRRVIKTSIIISNRSAVQRLMSPGTYRFFITLYNDAGESERSRVLSYTLAPVEPDRAPGAPTNFRITNHNSVTSKTFGWDAPTDLGKPAATGYTVFLEETSQPGVFSTRTTSGTNLQVFGLAYGKTYRAFVRIANTQGIANSNAITFTIGDGVPSPPRGLSLSLVDEIKVRAVWQAPTTTNGAITGYNVYFRELLSGNTWSRVDAGNNLGYTIEGLVRGKTYEVDVSASTSAGESVLTNNPQRITIPDFEAPGPTGLSCRIQGQDFVLRFTAPTEDGGADLFRYRVAVTVPGQSGIKYLYFDYPQASGVVVDESVKTLFSLTSLPSGTYSFEASVRNEELDEYSAVNAGSRCTLNYTAPVSRPKPVTNIEFTKPSQNLVMTFVEPTDTGTYTFAWSISVTDRATNAIQRAAGRISKVGPNAATQTITTAITGDVFDNKVISAKIISQKHGTLLSASETKTQVYEDIVRIPNAPNVDSIELYSDNIPRITFDYPDGHEPITDFRMYEFVGSTQILRSEITNTFQPTEENIVKKASSKTYTDPGTYIFAMTAKNSAGESDTSDTVSFTVEEPPPPPPPEKPNPPTLVSVKKGANDQQLIFVWNWPTGTAPVTNIKFYESEFNPGRDSNTLVQSVDVTSVTDRQNIETTIDTTRSRTRTGRYYFYALANNVSGDSVASNRVSFSIAAPPLPVPLAPNLRRVERTHAGYALFVFDYSNDGANPVRFKFYEADGTLIATTFAAVYNRGQTSIRYTAFSGPEYTTPGDYDFYMRASNASGDSQNSATRSFTIPRPPPPKPKAPTLNSATFNSTDNSLNIGYNLDTPPNVSGIKVRVVSDTGTTLNRTITFSASATTNEERTEKLTSFVSTADGTYYVRVRAFNANGDSPLSNYVAYTIFTGTPATLLRPILSNAYNVKKQRRSRRFTFDIDVTIPSESPLPNRYVLIVGRYLGYTVRGVSRAGKQTTRMSVTMPTGAANGFYGVYCQSAIVTNGVVTHLSPTGVADLHITGLLQPLRTIRAYFRIVDGVIYWL